MKNSLFIFLALSFGSVHAQSKKELRLIITELQRDTAQLIYKAKVQENLLSEKEDQNAYLQRQLIEQQSRCEEDLKSLDELNRGLQNTIRKLTDEKTQLQKLLSDKTHVDRTKKVESATKTIPKSSTGKSEKTNNPRSSSSTKSDNPFDGSEDGSGFGSDSGTGNGPGGVGISSGRIRLTDPKVDDISSSENQVIYLRVTINAEGKIVNVTNLASKTSTSDQIILRKVMAVVKNQVRYNKLDGAGLEAVYLTVNINAN